MSGLLKRFCKINSLPSALVGAFVMLFSWSDMLAQCTGTTINLGPDQTICPGESVTFNVPSGIDSISWENGSTATTRMVSTAGTYIVTGKFIGSNLVTNGGFESGMTGFTSDYISGTSTGGGAWGWLSLEGTYEVTTSPDLVHSAFTPCSYNNNMLVVNGSSVPNSNVWCQQINVNSNTQYLFSTDVSNALFDFNTSNLQFFINGSLLGSVFSTTSNGCDWQTFSESWFSGTSVTAQICIVNQNTSTGGNDFALDNIYFAPICTVSDTVVISTSQPFTWSAGNDTSACFGNGNQLIYSLAGSGLSFKDASGNLSDQFTITAGGNYQMVVTDGCTDVSDDILVTEIISPELVYLTPDMLLCRTQALTIDAQFSLPGIIQWTVNGAPAGGNSNQLMLTPPAEGATVCAATNGNCGTINGCMTIAFDKVDANFSVTPIPGEKGTLQFQDLSEAIAPIVSLEWLAAESQEYSSTISNPIFHFPEIDQSSARLIVTSETGCKDTAYLTFEIPGPLFVYVPNTFTPDGSKLNNTWYYVVEGIVEGTFKMEVYDRWGERIWLSRDPDAFWDGKFHEELVPSGTYNWVLQYQIDPLEDPVKRFGHVNVLH